MLSKIVKSKRFIVIAMPVIICHNRINTAVLELILDSLAFLYAAGATTVNAPAKRARGTDRSSEY